MPSDRLGDFVSNAEAMAAWQPIAYLALRETARHYRRTITVAELAEQVQAGAEVTTRQPPREWIGRLLERVALQARAAGEPPLTSLCVEADGSVAPGYDRTPEVLAGEPDEHLERAAARHRLACYRAWAEDLPADGGVVEAPRVTARTVRRASTPRQPRPPREPKPAARVAATDVARPICPTCFQEYAANGTCGCL